LDDEVSRRQIVDDEHVRLLALGYQISAGLSALFSLFGLMYAGMGFAMGTLVTNTPRGECALEFYTGSFWEPSRF
jgi:hypothetical protein